MLKGNGMCRFQTDFLSNPCCYFLSEGYDMYHFQINSTPSPALFYYAGIKRYGLISY